MQSYPNYAANQNTQIARLKLNPVINIYVANGYRVISRTDDTAQLLKPKNFSVVLAVILFLFFAIPFFIYLFIYLGRKDKQVYITALSDGNLKIIESNGETRIYTNQKEWPIDNNSAMPGWAIVVIIVFIVFFALILLVSLSS